jgi:hypothetical protein
MSSSLILSNLKIHTLVHSPTIHSPPKLVLDNFGKSCYNARMNTYLVNTPEGSRDRLWGEMTARRELRSSL